MLSVIVADDHPLVLLGIGELFQAAPDIAVIGTATSGRVALELIREQQPDIALLDITMPELTGMDVHRRIVLDGLAVKVVFLTATLSGALVHDAMSLGIWGLILKEDAPGALLDCIRSVGAGRRWLPADIVCRAATSMPLEEDPLARLTRREREIADLVCEGLSNRGIAGALAMSEGTVGIHLQNIYRKLEITNRTMLAALRLRHGGPSRG